MWFLWSQDAAARFGVSDRVSLNTRVKSAVWDESAAEWVIRESRFYTLLIQIG